MYHIVIINHMMIFLLISLIFNNLFISSYQFQKCFLSTRICLKKK